MQFTRKGDYALRAMVFLAGSKNTTPSTIDEISKKSNVPRHFLAKILRDLTQANLLVAVKGARGGYRLAKRPADITLLDVIEATVGPIALNMCLQGPDRCPYADTCGLHPIWEKATKALKDLFGQTRLSTVNAPR
jgi:Rrf2 family protein